MKYSILTAALFVFVTYTSAVAQTPYKGLVPGKSRRAEVERVLGRPVKQLSETLVEYRPQPLSGRIYVQYRQGSAVVERIEFVCRLPDSDCDDFVASLNLRLPEGASEVSQQYEKGKYVVYYASPHFVAETYDGGDGAPVSARVAFYSRELYGSVVAALKEDANDGAPDTGGATRGTILGREKGVLLGAIIGDSEKRPPPLSGAHGEVNGVVKLRAADGSLQPAANATVEFYRTDLVGSPSLTKTDRYGVFQYVGLSQTANWVVVVSGPGMKWTYLEGVRTPAAGLEIVAEPGDGARPTREEVRAIVR
jgi:hypothetical protein